MQAIKNVFVWNLNLNIFIFRILNLCEVVFYFNKNQPAMVHLGVSEPRLVRVPLVCIKPI